MLYEVITSDRAGWLRRRRASRKSCRQPVITSYSIHYTKLYEARYPDAILFFRLGDFYEMFMEDAVTASRILDITLTSRNKGANDEVPLCGIRNNFV